MLGINIFVFFIHFKLLGIIILWREQLLLNQILLYEAVIE